jgi:DNA-binding HxlR family transcriptional regulator
MDTNNGFAASPDGRFDVMAPACPTRQVVSTIGDKWTLLVVYALEHGGTLRFSQVKGAVPGITQKMLTQTLRQLERDGLVSREVFAVVPPRVDYTLTDLGRSLSGVIAQLRVWAYAHMDEIDLARARYETPSQPAAPVPARAVTRPSGNGRR